MGPLEQNEHDVMALVTSLRALGATRVRIGSFEVTFAAATPAAPEQPASGRVDRVDVDESERAELESLRALRRRMEELGVDI